MHELSKAIDDFYQAFADVEIPRDIDGCPCCIESKEIQVLLSTPLRELANHELAAYAASALLTVGDCSDYLYFLPRIMEISIHDESWWPDIEVTARAILSTDFPSWPVRRRAALFALLSAAIDHIVDCGSYSPIDGWLCAIARLGIDVRPHLAKVETSTAAVLQYFEDNAPCLKEGKLCNGFWELPSDGHDVIVRWFRSEPVSRIPAEAYGYVW